MRVAINGWFWGRPETGSGQYLRRLVDALSTQVPESEFLVFLPDGEAESYSSNTRFIVLSSDSNPLSKVWWEQYLIPHMAARYNADLLHVPYWAPPLFSSLPTIVTVHDLIPLLLPDYRGNVFVRMYTSLVSAATPRAKIVLTDSQASKYDIQQHFDIPDTKIRAIPLAVDEIYSQVFHTQDPSIFEKYGLQPGYVFYLGGFDRRKNLHAIVSAFTIVKSVVHDAVLVIAGKLPQQDTHFTPDPRLLVTNAGLTINDVRFLGFVPEAEKPALYRGARLFLYPSQYEGFGYPPLEALSCGTPVVASHISSLPEVVGDAGVLLDPDDSDGLAGAMIHILNDDTFHGELQSRARKQAARFSWQTTANLTYAAYCQAVNMVQI